VSSTQGAFEGIFNRESPGHGGHARWRWDDHDLNRAATQLVRQVDGVLAQFEDAGHSWLVSIELDLVEGRFPELFASFFSDPSWDFTTRFYVPGMLKDSVESSSEVSTLVCELRPGRLMRLLSLDGGFRWGSALRVGAVQVPEESVPVALKGSLFDPEHATRVERIAKCAWAASADLNALAMWTAAENGDWQQRLSVLNAS